MSGFERRAIKWGVESPETQMRIAWDEIDELDRRLTSQERAVKMRLDWVLGLVVTLLITVTSACLVIVLAAR